MSKNKVLQFSDDEFRKASFSRGSRKRCVMVAVRRNAVGVRDSKDTTKTTLQFTPAEWQAFLSGVKAGEFNM